MNQNATRDQIITALREGKSNTAIARELRADRVRVRRIRAELCIPVFVHTPQPLTLKQKWEANTRPDGGHLEWTGWRNSAGVPVVRHRGFQGSAYRVAFRIHHGRVPEGQVRNVCGMPGCVAGGHLADRVMRGAAR